MCVICLRYEGTPYKAMLTEDLPRERVCEDPPYTHIGIDFAGPLFISDPSNSKEDLNKVYICLFTCASTRAIHLELTRDLSVRAFLLAFEDFQVGEDFLVPTTIKHSSLRVKRFVKSPVLGKTGSKGQKTTQERKVPGRSAFNFNELNTLLE